MKKALIILGVLVLLIGLYVYSTYNKLITTNESIDSQWAQVENQYQRRFNLIPNLVESVKGSMQQEQAVFLGIASARTRYAGAKTVNEKVGAATGVESALARLLVVMENYPQLKSTDVVKGLMDELAGTENRVAVERKRYNDAAKEYNLVIKRVPSSMVASYFGFEARAYFEASAGAETAPKVDLTVPTGK